MGHQGDASRGSGVARRADAERELAALVDAALERVAPTSPTTLLQELRSELVRLAQQHAARVVHEAVLARVAPRAEARPSRRGFQR